MKDNTHSPIYLTYIKLKNIPIRNDLQHLKEIKKEYTAN